MPMLPQSEQITKTEIAISVNELYHCFQYLMATMNKAEHGKAEPKTEALITGLLAYANGVEWNPSGSGAGLYRYNGSGWTYIG